MKRKRDLRDDGIRRPRGDHSRRKQSLSPRSSRERAPPRLRHRRDARNIPSIERNPNMFTRHTPPRSPVDAMRPPERSLSRKDLVESYQEVLDHVQRTVHEDDPIEMEFQNFVGKRIEEFSPMMSPKESPESEKNSSTEEPSCNLSQSKMHSSDIIDSSPADLYCTFCKSHGHMERNCLRKQRGGNPVTPSPRRPSSRRIVFQDSRKS